MVAIVSRVCVSIRASQLHLVLVGACRTCGYTSMPWSKCTILVCTGPIGSISLIS